MEQIIFCRQDSWPSRLPTIQSIGIRRLDPRGRQVAAADLASQPKGEDHQAKTEHGMNSYETVSLAGGASLGQPWIAFTSGGSLRAVEADSRTGMQGLEDPESTVLAA